MRMRVRIGEIGREVKMPEVCPYQGCGGHHFKWHQQKCEKGVRDLKHKVLEVKRCKCLKCGRTFRVYPWGVSRAQQTAALKGLSVMLYILGISSRGVEDVLRCISDLIGMRVDVGKSTVHRNVQEAGRKSRRLQKIRREGLRGKVKVVGVDGTHVKCRGKDVVVGMVVDLLSGEELCLEVLEGEDSESLEKWLRGLMEEVGFEVIVSDDADAYKNVADELGVEHGICRMHVTRNMLERIGRLGEELLNRSPPVPEGVGITEEQVLEDLESLLWIVQGHPAQGRKQLEILHERYCWAKAPKKGKRAGFWYRLRRVTLDLWDDWERYTLYRTWRGEGGERLPSTNSATERMIGWSIKERYRTMRGYKSEESILKVSTLIGWLCRCPLNYDLAQLSAA